MAEVKEKVVEQKKSIIETFLACCKKGFYTGVEQIIPAMILGYALVQVLKLTGIMDILATICQPVMAIFGLPGDAIVVLISAFFAKASGCATAALLVSNDVITLAQATILFPACILMGTLIGHYVRIVIVTGANKKWHPLLLMSPLIDAAFAMFVTRIILMALGLA